MRERDFRCQCFNQNLTRLSYDFDGSSARIEPLPVSAKMGQRRTATKLAQSNGAGGGFALPGFGLMLIFVLLPFFCAFGLSLTNQRLMSPNPTEFVGLANYRDLLGLGIITLDPVPDDAGALSQTKTATRPLPNCATSPATTPSIPVWTACASGFRGRWAMPAPMCWPAM